MLLALLWACPAEAARPRFVPERDCAQSAGEAAPARATAACATWLAGIARELAASPLAQRCSDLPDLVAVTEGRAAAEGALAFEALGQGRWLVRVRCGLGAYNESALFLLWDATAAEAHPLLLFPAADGSVDPVVFVREFESRTRRLWELRKLRGDGRAGVWRRFVLDATSGVPRLELEVQKELDDGLGGYDYARRPPNGPGWRAQRPRAVLAGCLAPIGDARCPARRPPG